MKKKKILKNAVLWVQQPDMSYEEYLKFEKALKEDAEQRFNEQMKFMQCQECGG